MVDTFVALKPQFSDTIGVWSWGDTNIGDDFGTLYQAADLPLRFDLTMMFPIAVDAQAPATPRWSPGPILITNPRVLVSGVFAHVENAPGEGIILTEPVTGVFGVGPSSSEAIADFLGALRDYADSLAAEDRLSPTLEQHSAYLKRHLVS